ncbi:amidohydrolase family protein [Paenibacillus sp. LMG 31461]|uniref:Amidohydrolase family protein n=1 Tax=Paenibacillus plantarum TaxID=2654975 RepID=A0ABX1XHC6_9BACL|nr:amidohydrolase family protein [Paenibacillus plantarum]NOU67704.1 amidohydrolase family protein [Paenibacillus plantarum]
MTDSQETTIIYNATLLLEDAYGEWEFQTGGIRIHQGKIVQLGRGVELSGCGEVPEERTWDAKGAYLTPAFTNAHAHSYTGLLKRTVDRRTLDLYMLEVIALGTDRSLDLIYDATLLHASELISWGYARTVDHFSQRPFPTREGMEAAIQAYRDIGMKAVIAPMFSDIPYLETLPNQMQMSSVRATASARPADEIRNYERLLRESSVRLQGSRDIQVALGVDGPQRCTKDTLAMTASLMRELDIGWQTHLLESHTQWSYGKERDISLPTMLDGYGLLGPKTSLVHAIWLADEECERIARNGSHIVHCPTSNMHLGSGISPLQTYRRNGVQVFLGSDGDNCGTSSPYELMRTAARLSRLDGDNASDWWGAQDAYESQISVSTLFPEVLGKGRLSVGEPADWIAYRPESFRVTTPEELFKELVYYETGRSVEAVMIDGNWKIKDGVPLRAWRNKLERAQKNMDVVLVESAEKLKQAGALFHIVQESAEASRGIVRENWVGNPRKIGL